MHLAYTILGVLCISIGALAGPYGQGGGSNQGGGWNQGNFEVDILNSVQVAADGIREEEAGMAEIKEEEAGMAGIREEEDGMAGIKEEEAADVSYSIQLK
jgi:hypothetical protein